MVAPFHNQVRLDGYDFKDTQFTVKLATSGGGAVAVDGTSNGLALTWDASAANQMKLAGDADPIHAFLIQTENRLVEGQLIGTVSLQFAEILPIKAGLTSGQVVAVGSVLCGSSVAGSVRAAVSGTDASYTPQGPRCVELRDSTHAVVIRA